MDQVAPDIDCTNDPHDLYGNFDPATDTVSGISGYQFCIGSTPGGSDAWGWTSLPAFARVLQATNINPPNGLATGIRYYTSVRAINGVGSTGPVATSDGQVVIGTDTGTPTAPASVWDGLGTSETSTTGSTTQLAGTWTHSTDNTGGGVYGYQFAIGTTSGGTDILNYNSSWVLPYQGTVQTYIQTGLSLTVGKTYYWSVRAVNGSFNKNSACDHFVRRNGRRRHHSAHRAAGRS